MNRWLAAALVGVLLGCGAVQTPRARLQDDLRAFQTKLRWKKWGAAAQQVTAANRAEWLKSHRKAGRGLQLTDVRLDRVEAGPLPLKKAKVFFTVAWQPPRGPAPMRMPLAALEQPPATFRIACVKPRHTR